MLLRNNIIIQHFTRVRRAYTNKINYSHFLLPLIFPVNNFARPWKGWLSSSSIKSILFVLLHDQTLPAGAEELSDPVYPRTVERTPQHTTRRQMRHRQGVLATDGESQQDFAYQYREDEAGVPAAE